MERAMKLQNALCSCGSGLRSCRCCELSSAYAAPAQESDAIASLFTRTQHAFAAGDMAAAERLCVEVLDVAPRIPGALWMLYQVCRRAGREQAAAVLLAR